MDTIKALQIVMAALSAALIKEFYDTTKQSENANRFIAEVLMSTLVGIIMGFLLQKYVQDIMFIMGLTAASTVQGPESLNKLLNILVKIKGIKIDVNDIDKKETKGDD